MPSMSPARAATVAATMVLIWLATAADAAERVRRESCRAKHLVRVDETTEGRCMPLHECLESLKDVGRLKFPLFCGVRGLLPIVCCPNKDPPPMPVRRPATPAPSPPPVLTTGRIQPVVREPPAGTPCTVSESGQPGTCVPLDSCEPLQEQVRRKKFPSLCDLREGVAHACCPQAQPQVSTTTSETPSGESCKDRRTQVREREILWQDSQ
ncbi:hypothetical protein MRX96_030677 [Rhipicephalus microplus]